MSSDAKIHINYTTRTDSGQNKEFYDFISFAAACICCSKSEAKNSELYLCDG